MADEELRVTEEIRGIARSMITASHCNNLDDATFDSYLQEMMVATLKDAGYRKLPAGEPKLLDVPTISGNISLEFALKAVAQAQLDACVKFYKGQNGSGR